MREVAASLYLNEFGSSWKPVSSSRFNHGAMLTSALVEGRDFLRARAEAKRRAAMPEGTPVVAARAGVVAEAEGSHGSGADDDPLTDGGNYVRVRHADDTIATYAHLRHAGVAVEPGEKVEAAA